MRRWPRALISRLAVVEFGRQRAAEFDAAYEAALANFADDVRSGFFQLEPLADMRPTRTTCSADCPASRCGPLMRGISRSRRLPG